MAKAEISAAEIVDILRQAHPAPEWIFFDELRCGSGFSKAAQKRIDAWALNCWPSKQFVKIAYEIKVYRSDFLNELKHPKKRQQALKVSNQFYFIAPKGIIKPEEVPKNCGLIEVTGKRKKVVVEAPMRECEDPSWMFVASFGRRTVKAEGVDYKQFSDELIQRLCLFMDHGRMEMNGVEKQFFEYINNERIRRQHQKNQKEWTLNRKITKLLNEKIKQWQEAGIDGKQIMDLAYKFRQEHIAKVNKL